MRASAMKSMRRHSASRDAAFALHPDQPADAEALIAHCKEHLAPFKAPKAIRFVGSIARSATGKIQRRRLLELLG